MDYSEANKAEQQQQQPPPTILREARGEGDDSDCFSFVVCSPPACALTYSFVFVSLLEVGWSYVRESFQITTL